MIGDPGESLSLPEAAMEAAEVAGSRAPGCQARHDSESAAEEDHGIAPDGVSGQARGRRSGDRGGRPQAPRRTHRVRTFLVDGRPWLDSRIAGQTLAAGPSDAPRTP